MNEFLELVKERPDRTLKLDETFCPFCCSTDIKEVEHIQTLLGGKPDPNHHWHHCECNNCNEKFIKEHKCTNVWYTKDGKILAGIPNCFESYKY